MCITKSFVTLFTRYDSIIQKQGHINPIEVKFPNNTTSKSLHDYIDQFAPSYAMRLSTKNFGTYDNNSYKRDDALKHRFFLG